MGPGPFFGRALATASVQAFAQFEHAPELRGQLAATYQKARREIATLVLDRDDVDDDTRGSWAHWRWPPSTGWCCSG